MNNKGFTLLELMVAITIFSILVSIAVPSFNSVIESNRVQTQADKFFTTISTARSEAIKRNGTVTICKSNTLTSCASTGDWTSGWIIFADADSDGTVDSGETILKKFDEVSGGVTYAASSNVDTNITFRPTGEITTGSGRLVICGREQTVSTGYEISLTAAGRPRKTKGVSACS